MKDKAQRPFGLRDKIGYMFGDFGNDFTFILASMMLQKFYSDIMGVSVGLVGLMMMAARFVDAVTDVTMGQIVDRSRSTAGGKFRPWLLRMSGPVALSSFLMYAGWLVNASMPVKIIWMFGTYLLWGSVFYTGINIPYGSMASALSSQSRDRAQLSNWRTIGAMLAGTVIGVLLPLLVYYTDQNGNQVLSGNRVMIAAGVCSVGSVLCYLFCYFLCTERVEVGRKTDKFDLQRLIQGLLGNKALIGIVIASVCQLLVQLTSQTMTNYLYPNFYGNIQAQSAAGAVGVIVSLICAGFTVRLSERFGRKALGIAASVLGAVVYLTAWVLQIQNAWMFTAVYALAYVGLAVFSLICWAMITDVIDDTQIRSGARADGEIYSVYSFARKIGQAASAGITGVLLTMIGYTAETAFDPQVTKGIYQLACLVPAIGYLLLAVVLMLFYPLGKKRVQENTRLLSQKPDRRDFLICVDSDGCVMDTMESKHTRCFGPCMIREWRLEKIKDAVLEQWNQINLHGKNRGINRFQGLLMVLTYVDQHYFSIEGLKILKQWVQKSSELSDTALERELENRESYILRKTLSWSKQVNKMIEKMSKKERRPFYEAQAALKEAYEKADIVVVTAGNQQALADEWRQHHLLQYVDGLWCQTAGTQAEGIRKMIELGYQKDHILMIGDSVGDYEAAKSQGVFFYPIVENSEEESWSKWRSESFERFLSGTYQGAYQEKVLEAFFAESRTDRG